jgi:hypothetical protein
VDPNSTDCQAALLMWEYAIALRPDLAPFADAQRVASVTVGFLARHSRIWNSAPGRLPPSTLSRQSTTSSRSARDTCTIQDEGNIDSVDQVVSNDQ